MQIRFQHLEGAGEIEAQLEELSNIVPQRMLGVGRTTEVMAALRAAAAAADISSLTAVQLMEKYIKQVQNCTYYQVNVVKDGENHHVWLGITDKEVKFQSMETAKVLGTLPFKNISTWGHSSTSFVLVVQGAFTLDESAAYLKPSNQKMSFKTDKGEEMAARVANFVNKGKEGGN
jgi:hypothetical protein